MGNLSYPIPFAVISRWLNVSVQGRWMRIAVMLRCLESEDRAVSRTVTLVSLESAVHRFSLSLLSVRSKVATTVSTQRQIGLAQPSRWVPSPWNFTQET